MGQAKKAWMESQENGNLKEFLQELLQQDELKGALSGIAKQVIDKGENSMSEKQRTVVEKFVENYKKNNICKECHNGNVVNLEDYIFIEENGLCPMCEYDRARRLDE